MEVKKTSTGYDAYIQGESLPAEIKEDFGCYYCNGYEFLSFDSVTEYCQKLEETAIALADCSGYFFNECAKLNHNVSIFDLLSVFYVYLDSKDAVQKFAKYTELASDCGLLAYAYEPNDYVNEAFLVLDDRKGMEEYCEHKDEDALLDIFKALLNK